jgi:hypothetical protein
MVALLAICVRCAAFGAEPDGNPDAGNEDAGIDGAATVDGSAIVSPCDSGCPGSAGPCGVRLGASYCIDSTEVTVADYRAFVTASNGKTLHAGPPCGAVLVAPLNGPTDGTLPVTNVKFCEARAYCLWAGKELCGSRDGPPLTSDNVVDQDSLWVWACTNGGDAFNRIGEASCLLAPEPPAPPPTEPARAGTTCQGGVPGLFDMTGNVAEWVDSTAGTDGGMSAWEVGGSFLSAIEPSCKAASALPIDSRYDDLGFRCCTR